MAMNGCDLAAGDTPALAAAIIDVITGTLSEPEFADYIGPSVIPLS